MSISGRKYNLLLGGGGVDEAIQIDAKEAAELVLELKPKTECNRNYKIKTEDLRFITANLPVCQYAVC